MGQQQNNFAVWRDLNRGSASELRFLAGGADHRLKPLTHQVDALRFVLCNQLTAGLAPAGVRPVE